MKYLKKITVLTLCLLTLGSCGKEEAINASSQAFSSVNDSESARPSLPDGGPQEGGPGNEPHQDGNNDSVVTYSGYKEFTEDGSESDKSYVSSASDESAVLVKTRGVRGTLINPTVKKSGDTSSADNSSFYGQNASILATNGTLDIKGGSVVSDAEGGAGAAGISSGTINISGTKIITSGNAAGGIHVASGGTLHAWNLDVTTSGEHSAAIRSDRGGGTLTSEGGRYVSNGIGSPAVYSTADIDIKDATLISNGSEAACIEGKNSINLYNCDLAGFMQDQSTNPNSDGNTWGVILYQSMSGDSEVGTSGFSMEGGSLDIKNGGYFYTTNTASEFYLNNVSLKHTDNDDYEYLLRATGSAKWGNGKGADVNFTADNQTMAGKVIYDTASSLDFYLVNGSVYKGATEISSVYTGTGKAVFTVDKSSEWILTSDSEIDALNLEGKLIDEEGNDVVIRNREGQILRNGNSSLTLTVSNLDNNADTSLALTSSSYPEVNLPSSLSD